MPVRVRSVRNVFLPAVVVAVGLVATGLNASRPLRAAKTAFVTPLDAQLTPIKDLKSEEWGVREDGQDRKIIEAKLATDPLTIVILVDQTQFVQSSVKDMRTAIGHFTTAIMTAQPTASIAIVGFGAQAQTIIELGKPAADVDKAVQKINADQGSQTTVMLEAFNEAAKKLAAAPSPRRAIVAVNLDGFDETSSLPGQTVANAVLATHASVWSVTFKNSESARVKGQGGQNRDILLNNLPAQSGGIRQTVGTSSAIDVQLKKFAEVLAGQYAVTYDRPDGAAPKMLQMAVARPGAQMMVPKTPPQ